MVGKKRGKAKVDKSTSITRLKSAPTSCPSEKIHGGGWAGCGKGASSNHGGERGGVSKDHIILATVEWRRVFVGDCELFRVNSSNPICICILYLCLHLIVFAL